MDKTVPILSAEKFLIEQYKILRTELIKRTEFQYQVIGLSFVSFGTLLTIGVGNLSAPVILVYPFLALFLASVWSQNDVSIRQIRAYIIKSVENNVEGLNLLNIKAWETYREEDIQKDAGIFTILRSSRRIIVGMQLIAIFLALWIMFTNGFSNADLILLGIDIVIVFITTSLVTRRSLK